MLSSNRPQVTSEVPQGSLLRPVLFVLFIEKLLCVYEEKGLEFSYFGQSYLGHTFTPDYSKSKQSATFA